MITMHDWRITYIEDGRRHTTVLRIEPNILHALNTFYTKYHPQARVVKCGMVVPKQKVITIK